MKGVEKNEIVVFTHKGEEARAAFLNTWENLEEKDSVGVSLRWAVVAGDDDKGRCSCRRCLHRPLRCRTSPP